MNRLRANLIFVERKVLGEELMSADGACNVGGVEYLSGSQPVCGLAGAAPSRSVR